MRPKFFSTTFCFLFTCGLFADTLVIPGETDASKVIPMSMSGFTGVAAEVLKFDLEVAGFEFNNEKAQYQLTGSNNGQIDGRLTDRNKAALLARGYTGGNTRSQAHALANDVIFAITHKRGITQTKIAFKNGTGSGSEVFVADYDGHNAVALTQDRSDVSAPCWVPGQRKLLYSTMKSGAWAIVGHDLNSGERRVVSRAPGGNYSPAVSPDGRHVALILSKGGSPDLYLCDMDGSNLKQLTATKEDESSPTWSPDNRTICFVSRHGGRAALFTVSIDGGEPRRLNMVNALNATEPEWSPDGKTIIFTANMGGFNICTVAAEGGEAKVLVAGEDPSWAPNSRTVVFTRRQNNRRVLSLLDVPTKRVKDVTQISGNCSQPSWAK